MILPGNPTFTIVILIAGMLCWGLWANTFRLAGKKWRFELYYFDFAAGAVIAAVLAALTVGNLGWDGFSFLDDIRNAGKRQDLFAFLAGAVFNLGNMLLLASVSIAGMSIAFPAAAGLATVIGVGIGFILHPGGNAVLLGSGCLAILVAIVLAAIAYKSLTAARQLEAALSAPVRGRPAVRNGGDIKGVVVGLAGGVFLGCFYPLLEMAKETEIGLGPYALAFIFALGIFFSTFVFNLFFMNLPVKGPVVEYSEYFQGTKKQHGLGLLGGMLVACGMTATLVAAKAEGPALASPAMAAAVSPAAVLIAALCGIAVWKEFKDAEGPAKSFLSVMLLLLACGVAAITAASAFVGPR